MTLETRIHQVLTGLGPMTVRQLSVALSIHPQTARRKANALVADGRVSVSRSKPNTGWTHNVYEVVA